jgi:hypothetical protein
LGKKHHAEEAKAEAAKKIAKAAHVRKIWMEQKRAESRAEREREHKRKITQKHKEEQVRGHGMCRGEG